MGFFLDPTPARYLVRLCYLASNIGILLSCGWRGVGGDDASGGMTSEYVMNDGYPGDHGGLARSYYCGIAGHDKILIWSHALRL